MSSASSQTHGIRPPAARHLATLAVVTGAYFGAAKIGLHLSVAHGVITPVWPPTGIALAALLIFGPRMWPAVAAGALLANATSGVSLWVAAAIAVGNTLEAVVGAWLLRRAGFRPALDRARDVLLLTLLAGLFATTIAATNGVTTLAISGSDAASPYGSAWVLWWLGDAMGALLVAPFLLVWSRPLRGLPNARIAEGAALLAALAAVSAVVFLGGLWRYPYLVFPLLVWATLRFHQHGAATASFVVAAFAVAGVVTENTPLGDLTLTTQVEILQALIAFVAVSLLVLGATLSERDEAEAAHRLTTASLREAQELAHIGSWAWDIPRDRVTWSDELYRIYGLRRTGEELDYADYLRRIHPADRDKVQATVAETLDNRSSFDFTHRIVLDDGRERTVHGRGRVVLNDADEAVRMVGTAQDITDRRLVEELRDNILVAVSHELRTPLTAVLGFALTLKARGVELTDEQTREIIDRMAEQAERLERLLADLLDLDLLRRRRARADLVELDVGALVTRVARDHRDGGHPLELHADPVVAAVDAAKTERIVENLIANAVKHTPPGTPIAVSVRAEGPGVLIRVDDGGPGIPDGLKHEIFELFARGGADDSAVPGTGIGLALVAQFAALQGGRAWVEDGEAGGASFRVTLPGERRKQAALD